MSLMTNDGKTSQGCLLMLHHLVERFPMHCVANIGRCRCNPGMLKTFHLDPLLGTQADHHLQDLLEDHPLDLLDLSFWRTA